MKTDQDDIEKINFEVVENKEKCISCGFKPECNFDLFNHGYDEHGILITCDECKKIYKGASDLYMHKRVTHNVFCCRYCDSTYGDRRNWRHHENMFHSDEYFGFGLYDETNDSDDWEPTVLDVVEVYAAVDVNAAIAKIEQAALDIQTKNLETIKKLDEEKDILTIASLRAQIATAIISSEQAKCAVASNQDATNPTRQSTASSSGTVVFEKPRICPCWTKDLSYDLYRKALLQWDSKNKSPDDVKYYEVIESLKKNDKIDGLQEHVNTSVCPRMLHVTDLTVARLVEILDEQYAKTQYERVKDVLQLLFDINANTETDPQKYINQYKDISKKILDENIEGNINFLLMVMMIEKGVTKGVLTDHQREELKTQITTDAGDINGLNEELIKKVDLKYRRLKIEGK